MHRRKFITLAALSGLAIGAPLTTAAAHTPVVPRPSRPRPDSALLVVVHAAGGWDPRFVCDPTLDPDQNRVYKDIASVGGIAYAPISMDRATTGLDAESAAALMGTTEFFESHVNHLLCINGIDAASHEHGPAVSNLWTGSSKPGEPSVGQLHAVEHGGVFISGPREGRTHPAPQVRLPGVDNACRFQDSCDPDGFLDRRCVVDVPLVAQALVRVPGAELRDLERFMRQAQIVLAAFEAGIATSVHLRLGGFDTHGSHDQDQVRQLGKLLRGLDFLMTDAGHRGLSDRLTVMVGSEFGRGPYYDSKHAFAGKGHWPFGSAMLLGSGIDGGRVVGGTDDGQIPQLHNGMPLGFADVHAMLRSATSPSLVV